MTNTTNNKSHFDMGFGIVSQSKTLLFSSMLELFKI